MAKKLINFEKYVAELNVFREEDREDIRWLIKNYNNKSIFSAGESKNLEKLLREVYGVLSNDGTPNHEGLKILEGKQGVLVPEYGVYEIIIYYDFISDTIKIIDFKYLPKNYGLDGTEDFVEYKKIESVEFTTWNEKQIRFKVRFIKSPEVEYPRVSKKSNLNGELEISVNEDKEQKIVVKSDEKHYYEYSNFDKLDLDKILFEYLDRWDISKGGVIRKFDEIKNTETVNEFVTNFEEEDIKLYFKPPIKDEDLYYIKISNIPVIPENVNEAKKWAIYLILKGIENLKGYFSLSYLINYAEEKILQGSTIKKYFPDLIKEIDSNDLLSKIKEKNPILFTKVHAMIDLSIK